MADPKQPRDYVTPSERVDGGVHGHVNKVIEKLSSPGSILLFVVAIVLIFGTSAWLEGEQKRQVLGRYMQTVERNRTEELQSCIKSVQQVIEACVKKQPDP